MEEHAESPLEGATYESKAMVVVYPHECVHN